MRLHQHSRIWLLIVLCLLMASCNDESRRNSFEQDQNGEIIKIRPSHLTADEAFELSEKLRFKNASKNIFGVLRFVSFMKRGQREPALAALEIVNHKLVEAIIDSVKERNHLQEKSIDVDLEEGLALRSELQSSTFCEREVAAGSFVPLTGKQFCLAYDSGILDFLPFPSKLLSGAGRLAAEQAMARLPRSELMKFPQTAAVMARFGIRRAALRQDLAMRLQREDELAKQLLELTWNVTTGLASSD